MFNLRLKSQLVFNNEKRVRIKLINITNWALNSFCGRFSPDKSSIFANWSPNWPSSNKVRSDKVIKSQNFLWRQSISHETYMRHNSSLEQAYIYIYIAQVLQQNDSGFESHGRRYPTPVFAILFLSHLQTFSLLKQCCNSQL